MITSKKKIQLQQDGSVWRDGDYFYFTARSISEDFACDYVMDLLVEETPNQPLVFRHRHPAGNDDKIVSIFGRGVESKKVLEDGKKYMRTTYKVREYAPDGTEIADNVLFAKWVEEKNKGDDPIGISLYFYTIANEKGKIFYAETVEHSGTHVPACENCLNLPPQQVGVEIMEKSEKVKEALEGKSIEELQQLLESKTLEKQKLEDELKAKETDFTKLENKNIALEKKLEDAISLAADGDKLLQKLSSDAAAMRLEMDTIKEELKYEKSPAKKLIDDVVRVEKRPELEGYYRQLLEKQPKEGMAYLETVRKRLEQPKDVETDDLDVARKILEARKKRFEDLDDPSNKDVLNNINPNLQGAYQEYLKKKGRVIE